MKHRAKGLLLIAALVAALPVSAAEPPDQPWDCVLGRAYVSKAATRLKPKEAIALASKAAKKEGLDLAKFRQSTICFDAIKTGGEWTVFYDGRELRVGNHFLVWVRDDTGATKYMHGE